MFSYNYFSFNCKLLKSNKNFLISNIFFCFIFFSMFWKWLFVFISFFQLPARSHHSDRSPGRTSSSTQYLSPYSTPSWTSRDSSRTTWSSRTAERHTPRITLSKSKKESRPYSYLGLPSSQDEYNVSIDIREIMMQSLNLFLFRGYVENFYYLENAIQKYRIP